MPQRPNEILAVYRGKVRPAVVVSLGADRLTVEIQKLQKGWQTQPTMLCAPYFGAHHSDMRRGFDPQFIERIRRAEYPQYLADRLPIGGETQESILRFDQVFPVALHSGSFEATDFALGDDALAIFDEWFSWSVMGILDAEGVLGFARRELLKLEASVVLGTEKEVGPATRGEP